MTPIKYIGKREEHIDGAYATRIHWKKGETQLVPDDIAVKMLRHIDVFTLGKADGKAAPAVVTEADIAHTTKKASEAKIEDEVQTLRDSVANMDKDGLANFAQIHFNAKLDSRASVATLRERVTMMIDQYGIE